MVVVYSDGGSLCSSDGDDDVLAGVEGDVPVVVVVGVLVTEEEGSCARFYEVGWLVVVEALETAEDEVVGLYDVRLRRVVCVAGHRGVDLEQMLGCFDYAFRLLVHLNQFK